MKSYSREHEGGGIICLSWSEVLPIGAGTGKVGIAGGIIIFRSLSEWLGEPGWLRDSYFTECPPPHG